MVEHVHKLTRLHVGPPKRFYCEEKGCGYEQLVHPEPVQDVTTTVAAAAGELMLPRGRQPSVSRVRSQVGPPGDVQKSEDEEGEF